MVRSEAGIVEIWVWDYDKSDYVPVKIREIRVDDAMIVGGRFKITVNGQAVYENRGKVVGGSLD